MDNINATTDKNVRLENVKDEGYSLGITTGRLGFWLYAAALVTFIVLVFYYIQTRYHHLIHPLLEFFVPGLFAFLGTVIATPLCMKIAHHYRIVDKNPEEKSGQPPVPLLGGLALYVTFMAVISSYWPWPTPMRGVVIGATIIFIVGLMDDIWRLSSTIRLAAQLLACWIVMSCGLTVSFMPHNIWGDALTFVITLVWILGVVNATNFIDGVDGLAAGFAMIATTFFFLITLHLGQYPVALLAAVIHGSSIGFLIYNFKPAKIYLGDAGSTFLGFLLACIALYGGWSSWEPIVALSIPILILGVLIFDMIYITVSRIKNGQVKNVREWLDYRGRDHFHHRLMKLGFSEVQAVLFIYLTCVILGLSVLVIEHSRVSFPVVILFIQTVLIFIMITMLMLRGR